jgi:rhodanese-related sulfurtransferase
MKIAVFFFCSLLLLTASIAVAQDFKNISTDELKEKIAKKENILIVDTRTSQEYMSGHLPTAINIAPPQFRFIENQLPKDKNIPIAFYCRGYS